MSDIAIPQAPFARLRSAMMAWLTTVNGHGQPHSTPVWFLLGGDNTIWIRSKPDTPKIRNIRSHPQVAFHLDGDGQGGDIVTIDGTARVVEDAGDEVWNPYIEKYREWISSQLGGGPADMFAEYSAVIAVTPSRVISY